MSSGGKRAFGVPEPSCSSDAGMRVPAGAFPNPPLSLQRARGELMVERNLRAHETLLEIIAVERVDGFAVRPHSVFERIFPPADLLLHLFAQIDQSEAGHIA